MELVVRNVYKEINGNKVLKDVNLHMESGKVYGLVGRNGSGKTMLFRALSGLIKISSGEIIWNNNILHKDIEVLPSVGIVLENAGLYPELTGLENLKLLAKINKKVGEKEIIAAIERVGMKPFDKRIYAKYSLGMKQKLGIVCAIMENPDIVILDEPINALDEESVERVKQVITRIKTEDKIIIIACHDKEELFYLADKIIEIEDGKVKREYLVDNSGEINENN